MNTIENLQQLYFDQLRDLYSAETQLVAALPEMVKNATNDRLRDAFADHLEETCNHVSRIERLFVEHGITAEGEECDAMRGLIEEAKKHIASTAPGDVRDAVLIASANRIEHYEIAGYGVAKAFAEVLEFDSAVDLLDQTLQEEGTADKFLTSIATGGLFSNGVNEDAVQ
ncbi:MAG: ferritin-like domain-containing protein [Luteolibacter sp.]|uniref:YciE/YciF ferroxidase family protein n=1 Tax=Luteolibacter sp. TaxID=1962973 RepID=UPI00326397CD